MNKKICSIISISLLSIFIGTSTANASSSRDNGSKDTKSHVEMNVEKQFSSANLSDNDKVLPLEDGGYLHGKALYGVKQVELNSQTDARSITVKEAKSRSIKNFYSLHSYQTLTSTEVKGAGLPDPNNYITLPAGSDYFSEPFSGSGWRFGGVWIIGQYEANGHTYFGGKTAWSSFGDSGRVGDYTDALNQYLSPDGPLQGVALVQDGALFNVSPTDGSDKLVYFTYNPNPGTTYHARGTGLP
ncbi:TPA: hypothetical protein KL266_002380 [Enterococcus faecalis]|nr:hypothetical protein [Enterococcus faecalis]HBE2201270.1 hypothetical protein [Enterococcus faecalis]